MAKNTEDTNAAPTTETAPAFVIEDFTKPETKSVYAPHVEALVNAGDGKSLVVTVPAEHVARERTKFQRAANDADRTARVVETVASEDGKTVALRFILKARETRPGSGPRGGSKPEAATATVEDVPSE